HSYARDPAAGSWLWVKPFLELTYKARESTLERYLGIWQNLEMFLDEKKIEAPAHFTRQHCFDYMAWRAQPDKRRGKFRASHNTALFEIKVMRIILTEAIVRELCPGNPCVKLKIRRELTAQAPELTNDHLDLIRNTIAQVQDPALRRFYEITF